MSFKQVTELRKAGNLDEALTTALADLESDSDNIWNKRSIAWVYYSFIKKHAKTENYESFIQYVQKLIDLNLPEEEKMVFDYTSSQIVKMVFALNRTTNIDLNKINQLFNQIKTFHLTKESESYSFIYRAFHKVNKEWNRYLEFADWWNFDNFCENDFKPEEFDGNKILSIAERAYMAYAKKALTDRAIEGDFIIPNSVNKDRINSFLPKLEVLMEQHPEYQYPAYFKAKLLLALGDKENMLSAVLPFAKQKQNDFWVWEILAEAFPINDERHLACLCKAMTCKAPEMFMVNIHKKLVPLLLAKKMYNEAKTEINAIVRITKENQWNIPGIVSANSGQNWYQIAKESKNNKDFYYSHSTLADEVLFHDVKEQIIVVEYVNRDKKMVSFVAENRTLGFFKFPGRINDLKMGELYSVRIKKIDDNGFHKLYTLKSETEKSAPELVRDFQGVIEVHTEKKFGFVEDVFIAPPMIDRYQLKSNDKVSVKAVLSFNKKKSSWGWKAISITLSNK